MEKSRGEAMELYNQSKKQCLKNEIIKNIETIIDTAEKRDSLDFFNIEISNHQGKLNIEYRLKNRKKVY